MHFREWKVYILFKFSLKFVPKGPIGNNPAFGQIMAWRRVGHYLNQCSPIHRRICAAIGGDELRLFLTLIFYGSTSFEDITLNSDSLGFAFMLLSVNHWIAFWQPCFRWSIMFLCRRIILLYPLPSAQRSCWGGGGGGYIGFTPSVRPSVRPSVCPSVRPSRIACPLCSAYSSGLNPFHIYTSY